MCNERKLEGAELLAYLMEHFKHTREEALQIMRDHNQVLPADTE